MGHKPEKYQRRSIRLKGYDYSEPGWYFITVRTKRGECLFGEVARGEMFLSDIGKIVEGCWMQIPQHFPFARLDFHQTMPNHFHGIVEIVERAISRPSIVRTRHAASIRGTSIPVDKRQLPADPVPGSLQVIIGSFKSAATKQIHEAGFREFAWLGRFYEHVIRDGEDLDRIREYIRENPANWSTDEDFPRNMRLDRKQDKDGWFAPD